jgi:transposase
VRVLVQDEARFGQQGTLTHVWARRGSRPTVERQNGRKSVWVFAAVEPATGWSTAMVSRSANTEAMQVFLDITAAKIAPREHAVMVLDGAGWHRAKELRWPRNITPLYLPAYSPELNCVERVWLWLREHQWSNRSYITEDDLIRAAIEGHRALDRATVRSLCTTAWLTPEGLL